MSNDICQRYHVDQERVARARARMRDDRTIVDLAETFKALSEPSRVRILHVIAEEELCVVDYIWMFVDGNAFLYLFTPFWGIVMFFPLFLTTQLEVEAFTRLLVLLFSRGKFEIFLLG